MALHFEKTSVLSSSDGVQFDTEKEVGVRASSSLSVGSCKPLYVQLAEQAARKEEEYEAVSKLLRGTERRRR